MSEPITKKMRVTIKDIAAGAGVTDGTVSRALAGDSRVNLATREKIVKLARKMGYRPHASARSLRSGETKALGVFCEAGEWIFYNQYYGHLIAGLAAAAEADDINLIFYFPEIKMVAEKVPYDWPMKMRGLGSLADGRVDGGIILGGRGAPAEDLERFQASGFPVVLMGNDKAVPGFPQLASGAYERTCTAMDRAMEYGHRDIGFIGLYQGSTFNQDSIRAIKDKVESAGAVFRPELMEEIDSWEINNTEDLRLRLARLVKNKATLILFADTRQATVALDLLEQMGLSIPGDISLMGFGPMPDETKARIPQLCLLDTDLEAAGRQVYALYTESKEGKEPRAGRIEWTWQGPMGTLAKI
jgi:DNA-binding LacI/PurR family transcriptional regulator